MYVHEPETMICLSTFLISMRKDGEKEKKREGLIFYYHHFVTHHSLRPFLQRKFLPFCLTRENISSLQECIYARQGRMQTSSGEEQKRMGENGDKKAGRAHLTFSLETQSIHHFQGILLHSSW